MIHSPIPIEHGVLHSRFWIAMILSRFREQYQGVDNA
ncbi:hypothetical protein C8D96_0285 [Kushneria marisflavi]|nr:hypothetical protein C8D96_0285 [Kushneria marisflavi]